MSELLIQYSTSPAFASAVIRRLCHSPFSHVDMVLPGEGLLGASGAGTYHVKGQAIHDPGGVRIRPFDPWPYLYPPVVAHVQAPEANVKAAIDAWRGQIGKEFDESALYDFLSDRPGDRDWRDSSKWFCSEGVIWAEESAGIFPWPLVVPKNRVSPADSLLINMPLLPRDNAIAIRDQVATLRGAHAQ